MKNALRALWFLTIAAALGANTAWAASGESESELGVAKIQIRFDRGEQDGEYLAVDVVDDENQQ